MYYWYLSSFIIQYLWIFINIYIACVIFASNWGIAYFSATLLPHFLLSMTGCIHFIVKIKGKYRCFPNYDKNCKIAKNYLEKVCWKYMISSIAFHNVYKSYNWTYHLLFICSLYFCEFSLNLLFSSNYVRNKIKKSMNSPNLRIFNQLICRLPYFSGKVKIKLYQQKWGTKLTLNTLKVIFSANETVSFNRSSYLKEKCNFQSNYQKNCYIWTWIAFVNPKIMFS